jgi:hypothetical protein
MEWAFERCGALGCAMRRWTPLSRDREQVKGQVLDVHLYRVMMKSLSLILRLRFFRADVMTVWCHDSNRSSDLVWLLFRSSGSSALFYYLISLHM